MNDRFYGGLLGVVLVVMMCVIAFLIWGGARLHYEKVVLENELVEVQNDLNGYKFAEDALEEGQWYE